MVWVFSWWEPASPGTTASWDYWTHNLLSLCYGWVSVLAAVGAIKWHKWQIIFYDHIAGLLYPCRLSGVWRRYETELMWDSSLLLWLLAELSLRLRLFLPSNVARRHQRDKEERPPAWTVFLWIRSVHFDLSGFIHQFPSSGRRACRWDFLYPVRLDKVWLHVAAV